MKRVRGVDLGALVERLKGFQNKTIRPVFHFFAEAGTPKRQSADRQYLKMPPEVLNYGVTAPDLTKVVSSWQKEQQGEFDLNSILLELWDQHGAVYEHRLAAVKLARACANELSLSCLEHLIGNSFTWVLIDEIGGDSKKALLLHI
jgi:hypothetical protein